MWSRSLLTTTLVVLLWNAANAAQKCHQCNGINCQRTNYDKTETCTDALDLCATVFEGQSVQAQGCYQQLSLELRTRCQATDEIDQSESDCHMCDADLCNNVGTKAFECLQCDSDQDKNCLDNAAALTPTRCSVSRASNSFCYATYDGKRTVRGCLETLAKQKDCLNSEDCILCSPMELSGCNRAILAIDAEPGDNDTGNGNGSGSGSGSGDGDGNGSGSGSGSGNGNGSGSGNGNSGGNGDGSGSGSSGGNDNGNGNGSGSGTGSGSGNGNGSGSGNENNGGNNNGNNGGDGSGNGSGNGNGNGSGSGSDNGNKPNSGTQTLNVNIPFLLLVTAILSFYK
ncbi:cell wall protein IFF6-like isoform X2 [Teleopsis dalmanni]|uniref:cell wall protein IFF6-like isoform X2 n=1 Tax=Teleopsis dalmanni TaxID=139649 RepID=UPI0018CD6908|nr:cell wall protein IFF6-like isoform X2 [Teleopsis dalmanni]